MAEARRCPEQATLGLPPEPLLTSANYSSRRVGPLLQTAISGPLLQNAISEFQLEARKIAFLTSREEDPEISLIQAFHVALTRSSPLSGHPSAAVSATKGKLPVVVDEVCVQSGPRAHTYTWRHHLAQRDQ